MAKQATMAGKPGLWVRMTGFLNEVKTEMKKSTWPTKDEVKSSTYVVLFLLVLMAGITASYDYIFSVLVKLLFKL